MMSLPPVVYTRKELEKMNGEKRTDDQNRQELKVIFAAELFSKLPEREQDAIIAQIEALLSHE